MKDVVVVGYEFHLLGISTDLTSKTWEQTLSANRLHRIAGTPAKWDGTIFATGNVAGRGTVFALDGKTGSFDWTLELSDERVYPLVRDRLDPELLLIRTATDLHAVTTDGKRLWVIQDFLRETRAGPLYRNSLTPNTDENFYYVPSAAEAMAIDRKSRKIVWRVPVDEPWAPPVPGEDRVFVPAGGIGFLAVEKATGEILWDAREVLQNTPVEIYSSRRRPIVGDDAVYANVGEYHVSFSKDGDVNWTTDLGGGIHSGPVSYGEANYVSGDHLYEIDKRSGKKRVIIRGLDTPLTPTVSNESLFVSGRKKLYKYAL